MKMLLLKFVLVGLVIICFFSRDLAQTVKQTNRIFSQNYDVCKCWQSKVDETIEKLEDCKDISEEDEKAIISGMECLLKMEGVKNQARFGGATKLYVSQTFPKTTADVASLYYISYLFYQKFDHANAIALLDKSGELSGEKAIKTAYKKYRKWFKKVKVIGLEKARKQNSDPLANSDVHWY